MKQKNTQKGFTLIGLMLTVMLVGFSLLVIMRSTHMDKLYYQARYAIGVMKELAYSKVIPNAIPLTLNKADKEGYIQSYNETADQEFIFTLGGEADQDLQGLQLMLSPLRDKTGNIVSWSCTVIKSTEEVKKIAHCN